MTKEDIEKAAIDYSGRDDGVTLKTEIYAFMAGAEWRINSVWHGKEEIPEVSRPVLAESIYADKRIKHKVFILDYAPDWKEKTTIVRWAYVSDLLPERKETEK